MRNRRAPISRSFGPLHRRSGPGRGRSAGFTLIEALTVVAVLVVLMSIAIPALSSFVVNSKVSGLSNEFSAALQQTRALAVSKNTCMTFCASTNPSTSSATCSGTATIGDFQSGWIVFRNPSCDATLTAPAAATKDLDMLAIRQGESNGYRIQPKSAALNSIMFDPRGTAALAAQGLYQVYAPSGYSSSFNRNVCVDIAGRSWVRPYDPTSCS